MQACWFQTKVSCAARRAASSIIPGANAARPIRLMP